ncbi:MAG: discoidin domain-containing protein [Paludibacteraceae bacterium]
MKKQFLKSLALVAMLLCGLTASAVDWSGYAWLGNGSGNAEYTNTYKITLPLDNSGTNGNAVNIQQPGFAAAPGIYCTFPSSISKVSVDSKIDGAGVVLYMTAFTAMETEVTVTHATGTSTFTVYNAKGSLDNINFALAENGAKAYASSGTAAAAIDGNNGTRWESEHSDSQWFVVNLGQEREFNTVQILWEGAYGKSFTVDYSTDSTTWTNFATITDQTLAGFPYLQTLTVDNPVTAQYVRFEGTARGTGYGYSFWEFLVMKATEDVLTTLELKADAAIAKVGESVALTVTGKNQNGVVMSEYGEVTYTVSPADAGEVKDGKYVPAKQGPATIVAAVDEIKSAEVRVFGYEGDNVALSTNIETDNKVIKQSDKGTGGTDAFYAVDGNEGSVWQGSATNGTAGDEDSRTFDSWFVLDLGAYYDINLITIKFEGACSDAYHVDASATNNGEDWVVMHNFAQVMGINAHTDYIYGENLANNTGVRYVRFWSTKASTQWGMKMYEMKVFATAGSAPADSEKPVMVSATLVSNNHNSAVVAVEATDNMGVASYKVVDEANSFNANFTATDGNITVTGLTPATTYNLVISAVDLAGNESEEAKTVQVTTSVYYPAPTTAAPVPTHEAANVKSIYSDTYTPAYEGLLSFNEIWWSNPSMEEKDIDGNKFLRYYGNMAGMIGWQFTPFDATGMTHLHVDIWPSITGTITMGPTYGNGTDLTTHVESVALEVVQEQWNSFDIDLTEHTALDLTSIFQNQFTGYSAQSEFSVDNVYFWKGGKTTLLDAQEVFPKVSKTIENGQLVIIRDGVKYNVVGSVIEK